MDNDFALARALQAQFDEEDAHEEVSNFIPEEFRLGSPAKKIRAIDGPTANSIIAPEWEDLDPTPDLHALFLQFNTKFFWGKLFACEVKWSPRMTSCAGVCSYQRRSGYCSIRLSVPLLKLRPRKDLVETLLHEMIHAFLFVTDGDDDHDGHGPAFHKHMHRINGETGTKISVYHSFHDEVALYQQHWWKCNGPCQKRPPFHGLVKRAMNRKPGPYDRWWNSHEADCGGTFTKIKEPEGFGQKKNKSSSSKENKDKEAPVLTKGQKDIRSFGSQGPQSTSSQSGSNSFSSPGGSSFAVPKSLPSRPGSNPSQGTGVKGNIFGLGGSSTQGSSKGASGSSQSKPKGASGSSQGAAKGGSSQGVAKGGGTKGNIFGFGGTSFTSPGSSGGGLKTKGRVGTVVVGPHSKMTDNSSGGQIISTNTDTSQLPSSQGYRIGGGSVSSNESELGASPDTVRQTLRDFWGSKFDAKTVSLVTKPTVPKAEEEKKTPKAKCPVCAAEVSQSEINSHLDACLQSPPPESSTKTKNDGSGKNTNPFLDEDESSPCPVCGKEVLLQEMNDHLDFCVEANS